MTHHDEGNYRAKREGEKAPAADIMHAIHGDAADGMITCAAAEGIAKRLSAPLGDVGRAIDLQELKITACQLGVFGYGKGTKIIAPAESVSADLERDIRSSVADGRISCVDLWTIAGRHGIKRLDAACACEKLGIRISKCQLGTF